jgi:hypothetical protein
MGGEMESSGTTQEIRIMEVAGNISLPSLE